MKTRKSCDALEQILNEFGFKNIIKLHGGLDTTVRDRVMKEFRKSTSGVMVSTNVLARGIDNDGVTLVVNYDVPQDNEYQSADVTYRHRIGRTGRFNYGIAISLINNEQDKQSILQNRKKSFSIPSNNLRMMFSRWTFKQTKQNDYETQRRSQKGNQAIRQITKYPFTSQKNKTTLCTI